MNEVESEKCGMIRGFKRLPRKIGSWDRVAGGGGGGDNETVRL